MAGLPLLAWETLASTAATSSSSTSQVCSHHTLVYDSSLNEMESDVGISMTILDASY